MTTANRPRDEVPRAATVGLAATNPSVPFAVVDFTVRVQLGDDGRLFDGRRPTFVEVAPHDRLQVDVSCCLFPFPKVVAALLGAARRGVRLEVVGADVDGVLVWRGALARLSMGGAS